MGETGEATGDPTGDPGGGHLDRIRNNCLTNRRAGGLRRARPSRRTLLTLVALLATTVAHLKVTSDLAIKRVVKIFFFNLNIRDFIFVRPLPLKDRDPL